MTEAELLAEVTSLCDRLGLLWHHDPDSRRSQGSPGFPDLVIVGNAVLFAELKSENGDTSPDQDQWLWRLDRTAAFMMTWRPSDLRNGSVWRLLKEISRIGS